MFQRFLLSFFAAIFKDKKVENLILATDQPRKQKALGRKVTNFDADVWDANCLRVVRDGNVAKVSQTCSK